ncbi:Zinc/iron permease [Rhypophila decipiens]|uniref:Zinc/iron permease n=1 Tax=Rhypophila decipiens TaxID=261697 RepID=A0AAN7BBR8_9PEZI|nr:Zinc/iron permease [Rhypophila decipiens]
MEAAVAGNDTQGWILCIVSGIACVVGASVIFVDIPIRLLPGKRDFRIQESSTFLAGSLSLSFGVMIFSALYSMLPSSKRYLVKDGWDERQAGFAMMGCFIGGFLGIQIVSRFLHQYMPSHVVDCDHSHGDHNGEAHSEHPHGHTKQSQGGGSIRGRRSLRRVSSGSAAGRFPHMAEVTALESTPLLNGRVEHGSHVHTDLPYGDARRPADNATRDFNGRAPSQSGRPSMVQVQNRVLSFVKDTKPNCDEFGPCFGYTDPCGGGCLKHVSSRSTRKLALARSTTGSTLHHQTSAIADVSEDDEAGTSPLASPHVQLSRVQSRELDAGHHFHGHDPETHHDHHTHHAHSHHHDDLEGEEEDLEAQHHHHVPTNAFLSIGLQTVIAIALHKFPEGFITYATNHANTSLGFSVFLALFVHNIAEGFSMALPLYLALGSRLKAMLWSSLLGGLSQPMGAGVAMLWFKIAKRSNYEVDNTAYGALFAITAGIMASVALQLFTESLSLNHHNSNLSTFFAFLGMILLGLSNAFV